MIYFDNAATTFPKPKSVINELLRCVGEYCGNPGRSSHALSVKSTEKIYETRELIARLLGINSPERVVFTYNATYALNLALKTFITKKCHVITSDIEHNSVIRPLEKLKRELDIEYSNFNTDNDIYTEIESLIRADTVGIISTLSSNVTGKRIDLNTLSGIAKAHGMFLIIDASQAIGHTVIDLEKTPCDVLCAPAHKALFGIQGAGIAVFSSNKRRDSFIEGGSGSDSKSPFMPELLPEAYEAGTLSTPSIVALGRGVEYVLWRGVEEIENELRNMTDRLYECIYSIKDTEIYGRESGIVSFNFSGLPSSVIGRELDEYGICVRTGLHCSPSAHKKLGTLDSGAIRVSLSCLNTYKEIDKFYKAMKRIAMKY